MLSKVCSDELIRLVVYTRNDRIPFICWHFHKNRMVQMELSFLRYLWGLQYSVRTGQPDSNDAVQEYCKEYRVKHGKPFNFIPDYLNKEKLTLCHWSDIAWFDETHRKACPGSADNKSVAILASKKHVYRVPRTNGKPDPINGTIEDYSVSQSYVKYTDEGRFCLGVCADIVVRDDGREEIVGKRLPLFDYTGQIILSPTDYDAKVNTEIKRVKKLQCGGQWVTGVQTHQKYSVYHDDPITNMPKIGKVMNQMFHTNNVYTIIDLCSMTNAQIEAIENIPHVNVQRWRDAANALFVGRLQDNFNRPCKIDYRKADNPYASRF